MPDEWLRVNDIAHEFSVGSDTVRRWLRSDKNPDGIPATLIGTTYQIKKIDYEKWKRRREGRRKKT